ncbi:hypothetical protein PsorP6_004994 [Peronosclerospora sorghi]|uniref:Uncharacterized protein n=1 Tax=Peronosclerospora sorghi TaxID=230839 RepID=A0ACC0W5P3_9STRA|nr:hypothetical protein PsorP6_004994 [Peronosclerospora sorghi]
MQPEELQGEPRWSSICCSPHPRPALWSHDIDEKLVLLVTQSTASGERFPVGVNWLEVSRVVRRSPVDCVKRYAFLHDARQGYDAPGGEQHVDSNVEGEEEVKVLEEKLEAALLDSEDEFLEEQSLSDFATPEASPKPLSPDTSGELLSSRPTSPGSPPPFAVARPSTSRQDGSVIPGESLFRWESLVNDPNYTAPVLSSPSGLRHRQSLKSRFGSEDDEAKERASPWSLLGPMSRPDSQCEIGNMAQRNYTTSAITHAFKELKSGPMQLPLGSPLIGSPRLNRKISNSEYPFLKEEDMPNRQSAMSSSFGLDGRVAVAIFNNPHETVDSTAEDLQRQMSAHLMRMSAMSNMSPFHGDYPFSGSVTQSALEDAFLDMAGSRLDTSNVLLSSRMSAVPATQSQQRLESFYGTDRQPTH